MKKIFGILIAVVLTVLISAVLFAQARRSPPWPIPPEAYTEKCFEGVYTAAEIPWAIENMRGAGCTHTEFDYIFDGYYLGRGIKIVITN